MNLPYLRNLQHYFTVLYLKTSLYALFPNSNWKLDPQILFNFFLDSSNLIPNYQKISYNWKVILRI
jgi:hypothetical protein